MPGLGKVFCAIDLSGCNEEADTERKYQSRRRPMCIYIPSCFHSRGDARWAMRYVDP